jgi:hypothetical protein
MPKKSKKLGAELIAVRVLREQEWVYRAWLAHLPITRMQELSARPEHEGGLGYPLGPHALKGRLEAYHERMREVYEVNVAMERTRIDQGYELRMQGYAILIADPQTRTGERLAAMAAMRAEDEGRRKYLGLDKPVVIEANVVNHDAVTRELNEMLVRMGEDPITGKKRKPIPLSSERKQA